MSKLLCSHSHGSVDQHIFWLHILENMSEQQQQGRRMEDSHFPGRSAGRQHRIQPLTSLRIATVRRFPGCEVSSRECWFTSWWASLSKRKLHSTCICSFLPTISRPSLLCSPQHTPSCLTSAPTGFGSASSAITVQLHSCLPLPI